MTFTATMTFTAFAFTAVSVATATSAVAFSAHELCHSCHFLGSSLAALSYLTLEVEYLASQRMVEVYFHLAVTDFQYHTVEAVAVLILQRNDAPTCTCCASNWPLMVKISFSNSMTRSA